MKEKKYPHIGFRPSNKAKNILLKIKNKSGYINLAIEHVEFLYNILNDESLFELLREYTSYELEQLQDIERRLEKCQN